MARRWSWSPLTTASRARSLYEHFASIDEIYLECHRTAREEMEQLVFEVRRPSRQPTSKISYGRG